MAPGPVPQPNPNLTWIHLFMTLTETCWKWGLSIPLAPAQEVGAQALSHACQSHWELSGMAFQQVGTTPISACPHDLGPEGPLSVRVCLTCAP